MRATALTSRNGCYVRIEQALRLESEARKRTEAMLRGYKVRTSILLQLQRVALFNLLLNAAAILSAHLECTAWPIECACCELLLLYRRWPHAQ
jgi:hypothetical protein